jgi:hypothetical protein
MKGKTGIYFKHPRNGTINAAGGTSVAPKYCLAKIFSSGLSSSP